MKAPYSKTIPKKNSATLGSKLKKRRLPIEPTSVPPLKEILNPWFSVYKTTLDEKKSKESHWRWSRAAEWGKIYGGQTNSRTSLFQLFTSIGWAAWMSHLSRSNEEGKRKGRQCGNIYMFSLLLRPASFVTLRHVHRKKQTRGPQPISEQRKRIFFFSAYLLSLAPSVLMGFQLCEHLVKQPKGVLSSTAFCCPLLHAFMESTEFSTRLSLQSKLSHYSLIFFFYLP